MQPQLARPTRQRVNQASTFAQPTFPVGRGWNFRAGSECQGPRMANPQLDNRGNDFRPQAGMQLRFQGPGQFRNTFQARAPLQGAPRTFPTGQATNRPELTCFRCYGMGHISWQCPIMQDPNQTRFNCYRCGARRHAASVCPTPLTNPPRPRKEAPRSENLNYQRPVWCPHCRMNDHIIRDCPKLEEALQSKRKKKKSCRMWEL